MDLIDALDARGLVCAVGAGGKKSTLYALADRVDRAVVTATVRIPPFADRVAEVVVTDDPIGAVAAADDWPLGIVPARERPDRYRGYDPATVAALAESADVDALLVKADGARAREFKAPGDDEPQLPRNADAVLPVASVAAVGEPLGEAVAHRPERVAALAGLDAGETITAEAMATVLAHPDGGLKAVPAGSSVVPVLNKVDDAAREDDARAVATHLLDRTDVARVALTSHARPDPLVDVVGDR